VTIPLGEYKGRRAEKGGKEKKKKKKKKEEGSDKTKQKTKK